MRPNVLVIGLGGIGTVAALSMELNDKADVSVIVRNQDEEFLQKGFLFDSVSFGKTSYKPRVAYKCVDEVGDVFFDYVVVCTKNLPDSKLPCERLIAPAIKPGTCIVLIQNGLDIEVPVLNKFPNNLVISGISLTGAWRYGNNVKHIAPDEVSFGIFKANSIPRHEAQPIFDRFVDAYKRDDAIITIDDNVELSRWYKLCYNAVFNTTCTVLNVDVTRCHIAVGNNSIFRKLCYEVVDIAKSAGYVLEPERVEYILHKSDGRFYRPSMQIDRDKNQLLELEVIMGNPLRIAERNGISAPNLMMIYNMLKIIQFDIREKQGEFKINPDDFRDVSGEDAPKVFKRIHGN
ncbi:hypothetical protein PSN45_000041 [Yamadazyma tenuis]|uniref:2-dehydropantoate 2-reductase n=1 Tax=Candida tenuis (strain ATCC 10573 / BCRC 21748 / CBS 615 / JCM 9827 / NBRC 10315 / NRRL Y-1498 / VKM Y-70) TaxID=590646 RepID=G3BA70_CANTC|nr:2-dehydropantoate 2-reductase [Yamadazyma tenuis ATCC 10573]EGV61373.1 2-dehydropantoate 2-reductase [Yamadazyma tenuis ATCC 10573]WEJ92588.1 hypothetical protein PSN45_000041 [Yamadazyma tenuis]